MQGANAGRSGGMSADSGSNWAISGSWYPAILMPDSEQTVNHSDLIVKRSSVDRFRSSLCIKAARPDMIIISEAAGLRCPVGAHDFSMRPPSAARASFPERMVGETENG